MPLAYGLFGSIIAALVGGFFGRSAFVALGPTNATAVLLLSALAVFPTTTEKLIALPMIVILSGIFLIIGAHIRLSGFIRFVSRTVITGYITAAAALIILNQLRSKERSIPEVSIVHVEGDLFFGASDLFQNQIRRIAEDPNLRVIILRLRNARHIDATSAMALRELLKLAREKGQCLSVCCK